MFTHKIIRNRADCNIPGIQFYKLNYNTFAPVKYLYCSSFFFPFQLSAYFSPSQVLESQWRSS